MAVRLAMGVTMLGACLSWAGVAGAQTWEGNRTTPHLGEALVVDASGESSWQFGTEPLAADEDVRSVYGARGNSQAWFRFYVSSTSQPIAGMVVYVFVDSDTNSGTGGPAAIEDIDPALTDDPSNGGYEFFVSVPADGTDPTVFEWDGAAWVDAGVQPNRVLSEVETDVDPLLLGSATHGYVQTMIDFGVAGLDSSCNADLYFRSTNGDGGDLEIGEVVQCVPRDANGDRIPDVLLPPDCVTDADCPGDGVCVDGNCVVPVGCAVAADCAADEDCVDGICVAQGGGSCVDNADCDGLVCDNGSCVPCGSDAQCDGGRCAADGRCVDADSTPPTPGGTAGAGPEYGLELDDGDEVRGGACKCQAPGRFSGRGAWLAALAAAALISRRRLSRS
jgi:hypothetical protein